MLAVAAAAATLTVAACASSAPAVAQSSASRPAAAAPSVTATPSAALSAVASSGYPQQAADEALCNQYQADSASGDLQAMAQAVAQAGSVSPALAHDIMNVVNNPGSVAQDERNMVYVAMDCGVVSAGKPPVELRK